MIKHKRKEKKMTLQQLGDLIGSDRQYVWRLENGKVNVTCDYLDNVIAKLDSKHEDFIKIPPTK